MHIRELELGCRRIEDMKRFYQVDLGLDPAPSDGSGFAVRAGRTRLRFVRADQFPASAYHFAFNIPENQIEEALDWLKSRVPPVCRDNEAIVHFPAWNAHSVYFRDPDGNVVELIARHSLPCSSAEPFSPRSLLNVSEIGLPVRDVGRATETLRKELDADPYGTCDDQFAAVGDEEGLIILVREGRIWLMSDVAAAPLHTRIFLDGGTIVEYGPANEIRIWAGS